MLRYLLLIVFIFAISNRVYTPIVFADTKAHVLPITYLPEEVAFDVMQPILPGIIEATSAPVSSGLPVSAVTPSQIPTEATPIVPTVTPSPRATGHVPVLMYHYIRTVTDANDKLGFQLSVTPEVFDKQMAYIKEQGFTTITPEDLYQYVNNSIALPIKPVLLTFDDGYEDFYLEGKKILDKYGLKATIFVPSHKVETPSYLKWYQLAELAKSPNITIASHTKTHAQLTALSGAQITDEIASGRQTLSARLGVAVDYFAYPYGAFNASVVNAVKQAGFKAAFSTIAGSSHSTRDVYSLKRLNVNGGYDFATFTSLLGP